MLQRLKCLLNGHQPCLGPVCITISQPADYWQSRVATARFITHCAHCLRLLPEQTGQWFRWIP
jgi:hypothetical protein